ncbi:MAG: CRISPR-associated protein Cas4 [Conexivisphaera sp.]|jgi:CRISPR-associated exonuclease Cas4|nr:CRISPR-associated protein Cas4 [Conexivisphaerales archaeon]
MESLRLSDGTLVTGTLIWYSEVCDREVWFISRGITPDPEDRRLDEGRALHEASYPGRRKEVSMEGMVLDVVSGNTVGEMKLSSRHMGAARLQLLYYLYRLKLQGLSARGEILVPRERRREEVVLDGASEAELMRAIEKVKGIVAMDAPPPPRRGRFCRGCAYRYLCWGAEL